MEVLQRTANRGSISTGLYEIDNSLLVEADDSDSIQKSFSSAGNRKTWTLSFWFKRTELGASMRLFEAWDGSSVGTSGLFDANDQFLLDLNSGSNYFTSTAKFRDTAAWYHFVIRVDTTSGTASERARVYVNGEELEGSWNSNIGQNTDLTWNLNATHYFGVFHQSSGFVSGYYAEIINVDGTSLAPTAFGETNSDTGIWVPIDASPTYGTNGFKLEFKSSGSLGTDTSGNSHTFILGSIVAANQATDTPTNNFCTWLSDGTLFNSSTDNMTFSEGGTQINTRAGTGWTAVYPTQSFAGGKWYMEVKVNENSATNMYGAMPVRRINSLKYQEYYHGQDVDGSIGLYANNGQIYWGTASSGGTGSALSAGDIVGLAIDMENYKMYFAVNNTYVESGNPAGNSNGRDIEQEPYVFSVAHYTTTTAEDTNFGGYTAMSNTHTNTDENGYGNFIYAPPSGFLAVCTKNLGENGG